MSLKAPGDSGQGQSAALANGGFDVYYAPDGADQATDPAAVRFDPGTDNGSGNVSTTVSTVKDQFSRTIEGAPESFYYDAFVYNALVPGAGPMTTAPASPCPQSPPHLRPRHSLLHGRGPLPPGSDNRPRRSAGTGGWAGAGER